MRVLNLTQGSDDWIAARLECFTASEAPAMMGASKYMSRDELLHMKSTGETKPVTSFQQKIFDKGHSTEAMARPIIEEIIEEDLYPVTGILENTKLLASFDGLTLMEDIVFEHKMWNETLAENVRNEQLEPQYYWQLEQQLLVSGAEDVIFVVSDGTKDKMETMYYHYRSVPSRRSELLMGWDQFEKDLENYTPPVKVEKVKANQVEELPTLMVELTGQVNNSNLAVYKTNVLAFVQNINTDLQTDQDFADAEGIVKFCKKAETEIEAVKDRALGKTADIKNLFIELDQLKEEMRSKRLTLDKTVKARKVEVKKEITEAANNEFCNYKEQLNFKLCGAVSLTITCDFAGAIKGKRTVDSIRNSANDHLAKCKIELDGEYNNFTGKLEDFEKVASEYRFLFNDLSQIIQLNYDLFIATVRSRVDGYKQEQAEIKRKEQERIEREAKEKAEREAQVKLDAEREKIRKEEQAKARVQQEAKVIPKESYPVKGTDKSFKGVEVQEKPIEQRLAEKFADVKDVPTTKKFKVQVEWSGYSRGYSIYEVEAENEDHAKEIYYEGKKIEHETVRDDTESQEINVI